MTDLAAAFRYAHDPDYQYVGVYYRKRKATFQERVTDLQQKAVAKGAGNFERCLAKFRTYSGE